ncbi:MAG: hypothetical protein RQ966_08560 [Acetobacteraceae bacterium]|nr:hypothetical protein [Acetobacteraceae bacterium]
MRTIGLVLLAAVTLAGCETGPSRQQYLASLVGRPESDVLRAMGAPNHLIEANGHRFLAYENTAVGYASTVPFGPFGFGYYYYPVGIPVARTCETTIEVADGKVVSWTLRGNACA